MKIVITTQPFFENKILNNLKNHNIIFNKTGKKYSQDEVEHILSFENPDIVIAGTEKYFEPQLEKYPNLKLISRVGMGLDSIDVLECQKRNIQITNTPDSHVEAVVEFVLAQILDGLRKISISSKQISKGIWNRKNGKSLNGAKIGLIGYGKVGSSLKELLNSLGALVSIRDPYAGYSKFTLEDLAKSSDVLVVMTSLNDETKNMINKDILNLMKEDAILINSSRGGIVNEKDLFHWLNNNLEAQAFLDVFKTEPYYGSLRCLENAILTPHSAGSTISSRAEMELLATEAVYNFIQGEKLKYEV